MVRWWPWACVIGVVLLVGLEACRDGGSSRDTRTVQARGSDLSTEATPSANASDECARVIRSMPSLLRHNRLDSFSDAVISQYKDILKDYDRACFKPYETLSPAGKTVVGAVSGALFLKVGSGGEERLRCSAFRVSPSVVATARHCLLIGSETGVFEPTAFTFRLFGAPDVAFPVQGHVPGQHLLPTDVSEPGATKDYWMLRVDTRSVPMPNPAALVVDAPKPDERVYVIVVGPNLFLPAMAEEQGKNWMDWIRYDDRNSCNTQPEGEAGCLPHRCNTLKGMSGAPMIGKRGNGPDYPYLLIGLHLRSAESSDPVCSRDPEGNLGIALPATLRDQFRSAARAEPQSSGGQTERRNLP